VKTSIGEIAYNSPIQFSDCLKVSHDMMDRRLVLSQMDQLGIEVWDMESCIKTIQRLSVVIRNYRYFSIPEPLGREIALLSLYCQQIQVRDVRCDSHDKIHRDAEYRYIKQAREMIGVVPCVSAHDGFVTVSLFERHWKGTLEDSVRYISWLRDFDSFGYIPRNSFAFMIQTSSVGDRLFLAPVRPLPVRWVQRGSTFIRVRAGGEFTFPNVVGDPIPVPPPYGRFFSSPVDMWRYQRSYDLRLLSLLGGNGASLTLSKKDPDTYLSHMDAYEALVGRKHDNIVRSIAEVLRVPIVVPGDGLGRFSRLWPYPCESSDINITPFTHSRVKKATLKDVIASDPDNCLILMYVWYALDDDDKALLHQRASKKRPLLIIDTRPEVNIGRRVNNMVYEVGFPSLDLPYFEHDSVEKVHGIKFNESLLSLKNPVFEKDSLVGRYYHFMRPFFKPEGEPVRVSDTIASFLSSRQYCYHVGRLDPEVVPFSLTIRLYNQTIYYLPREESNIVPPSLYREIIGNRIYFCSREFFKTRHFFSGITLSGEYNIHVVFNERAPSMVFSKGLRFSKADFDRLALSRGYSVAFFVDRGLVKSDDNDDDIVVCLSDFFPDMVVQEG